ncbi:glycosyltransferase [Neokomagataea anthophila]|uniref:Glycosyltransferase n=1 Tax=Neokomagataea anthophila TaxID=2826925 RepID=A0ABS5E5P9_9PROT|nr:glycosyltransferase [Neokomagataea anthophila]MBR0559233.1 glycosyltransferase [Neokomagataea anthophila]
MVEGHQRLHILHALSTREFAGTERHVAQLTELQAQEHDVTLLLERNTRDPRTGGDITEHLAPSVRVIRAGRLGYLWRLAALWRSGRYDIVHTHLGRASARVSWLRRLGLGGCAPIIATLHTRYRARSYGVHDGLVCIAQWQMDTLPREKRRCAALVPNWTALTVSSQEREAQRMRMRTFLDLPESAFLVVGAGRMVPEKGFSRLIKAWRDGGFGGATTLVLIGDGPEREALEAQARGASEIRFLGYRTDMPALLAAFDGFVLPSDHEPFGLVLLEAMAAGLPVCATAAGGVLDILSDEPESLVQPVSVEALIEGLQRLRASVVSERDMTMWRPEVQVKRLDDFYRALTHS